MTAKVPFVPYVITEEELNSMPLILGTDGIKFITAMVDELGRPDLAIAFMRIVKLTALSSLEMGFQIARGAVEPHSEASKVDMRTAFNTLEQEVEAVMRGAHAPRD